MLIHQSGIKYGTRVEAKKGSQTVSYNKRDWAVNGWIKMQRIRWQESSTEERLMTGRRELAQTEGRYTMFPDGEYKVYGGERQKRSMF